MLDLILLFGSIFGASAVLIWSMFAKRRIWVGKWKDNSVMVVMKGREVRVVLNGTDVFSHSAWGRDAIHEFDFSNVEHGDCSGVLLVQRVSSHESEHYNVDLILDGEQIPLIQLPSTLFNQASFEKAEMILNAKMLLKAAPAYDDNWEEVLNLCRDIRELSDNDADVLQSVETLQSRLRESYDMIQRTERAQVSYTQLSGDAESLTDVFEAARVNHTELVELLKALHASVLRVNLIQQSGDAQVEETVSLVRAAVEVEQRLESMDMRLRERQKQRTL